MKRGILVLESSMLCLLRLVDHLLLAVVVLRGWLVWFIITW